MSIKMGDENLNMKMKIKGENRMVKATELNFQKAIKGKGGIKVALT